MHHKPCMNLIIPFQLEEFSELLIAKESDIAKQIEGEIEAICGSQLYKTGTKTKFKLKKGFRMKTF